MSRVGAWDRGAGYGTAWEQRNMVFNSVPDVVVRKDTSCT